MGVTGGGVAITSKERQGETDADFFRVRVFRWVVVGTNRKAALPRECPIFPRFVSANPKNKSVAIHSFVLDAPREIQREGEGDGDGERDGERERERGRV